MDQDIPEEFIFFLFLDLNEIHYPVYLPLRVITEYLELDYDVAMENIEQELGIFLQESEFISRNDLTMMIQKHSSKFLWLIEECNNLIADELENIFGDAIMCAEHYLMWKGKGLKDYHLIKQDVSELAKLYKCEVHEIHKDQIDSFLIKLQHENSCRISNEAYFQKESTSLNEKKIESQHQELWPEEDIQYRMELCETIQAEIDAENGENIWINHLNDKIKSDKRLKLQEIENKMNEKYKENSDEFTNKFYMSNIIEHKKILEQFKNNYNIFKLLELIRKKYNVNIYNDICTMLKEKYIHNNMNRICTLLIQLLPLQIRIDPEIYEKIEILEIGYKIRTWRTVWTELITKIISKYNKDDNIEIEIKNWSKSKEEMLLGRSKRRRKSCLLKKKIKPK